MHLLLGAVAAAIAINLINVLPSAAAPISAATLDEARRAASIVQQAACKKCMRGARRSRGQMHPMEESLPSLLVGGLVGPKPKSTYVRS